jgi:NADP-dependent 3-hydroxy acid dehydrogenase YdfG
MADRIRLDGRVAVVTGAAGVIGTAAIRLLADRGARIVAVDRRENDLQTAIRDLPATAQALAITADVSDEDEVAVRCQRGRRVPGNEACAAGDA